jgi:hypothetical protein
MDEEHSMIDACLSRHLNLDYCYRFTARIDLITEMTIWEIKCTSQITIDHKLQLIIYAWLWQLTHPNQPKQYRLFNIKSGELWKLDASLESLTQIVVELLRDKYEKSNIPKTDEEFIHDSETIISSLNHLE